MHYHSLAALTLLSIDVVQAQIPLLRRLPSTNAEDTLPDMAARLRTKYGVPPGNSNAGGSGWVSVETGEVVDIRPRGRRHSRIKRQGGGKAATTSIVNLQDDTAYYTPVCLGTPPTCFNVIVDTGSSDLWVAGKSCRTCSADTVLFDQAASSTFTSIPQAITLNYLGGKATGALGSDVAIFPSMSTSDPTPFTVSNQTFGVMDDAAAILRPHVSGVLGLAFQPVAVSGAVPPWEALAKGGAWTDPLMSFYFTRHVTTQDSHSADEPTQPGGQFTMGGTNNTLFTGDIDFVSIPQGFASSDGHWTIPISSIHVDSAVIDLSNSTTVGGQLAAIDTGSSLIGGPADVVSKVYSNIQGALRGTGASAGYYAIPCTASATLSFTFTSHTWTMSAADLIYSSTDQSGYCMGALFEVAIGSAGQVQWVVGQPFLKNVYTVLRYNPAAVGFAQLSGVDGSLPPPDTSGVLSSTSSSISGGSNAPSGSTTGAGTGSQTPQTAGCPRTINRFSSGSISATTLFAVLVGLLFI